VEKVRIFHSPETHPATPLCAKTAASQRSTNLFKSGSREVWGENRGDPVGAVAGGALLEGGDTHAGGGHPCRNCSLLLS